MKMTPKNEDAHKSEDDPKNKNDPKNEDGLNPISHGGGVILTQQIFKRLSQPNGCS